MKSKLVHLPRKVYFSKGIRKEDCPNVKKKVKELSEIMGTINIYLINKTLKKRLKRRKMRKLKTRIKQIIMKTLKESESVIHNTEDLHNIIKDENGGKL